MHRRWQPSEIIPTTAGHSSREIRREKSTVVPAIYNQSIGIHAKCGDATKDDSAPVLAARSHASGCMWPVPVSLGHPCRRALRRALAGMASTRPNIESTVPAATNARWRPAVKPACPLPRRHGLPHGQFAKKIQAKARPIVEPGMPRLKRLHSATTAPIQSCTSGLRIHLPQKRVQTMPSLMGHIPTYLIGFQTCGHIRDYRTREF